MIEEAGINFDYREIDAPCAEDELLDRVQGVDAILCTLTEAINEKVIEAAGDSLKLLANMAIGYNNIDIKAAIAKGILVTNTPDTTTIATADLTWTLILSVARRAIEGDQMVRKGEWKGWGPLQLLGGDFDGNTIGIIGAGAIGSAVAKRAIGFGMKVVYYSRSESPRLIQTAPDAKRVDLETLLKESDIVSLHIPYTPETHHLIGKGELELMKPSAYFINASRGPIHDEQALVDALKSGQIAGAGLDVYEEEPKVHPDLVSLSNAVLLPHLGSATERTRQNMSMKAARNIVALSKNQTPPDLVAESRS